MKLIGWVLIGAFLQFSVGQNANLTDLDRIGLSTNPFGSDLSTPGPCETLQSILVQHNWIVDQQLYNLAAKVEANQLSILERLNKLETFERDMTANQKVTELQLDSLVANVSKQLQDHRFKKVNAPACPSFEKIAKLQNPNLRFYCDNSFLGKNWIVIQQRLDGSVDFNRSWADYRDGFGTASNSTEFWLGLEAMHWITNQAEYGLVVQLKGEKGMYVYSYYSSFRVGSESEKYSLSLGKYTGTTCDAMRLVDGMQFSTYDQTNDNGRRCAQKRGGWWYQINYDDVCTTSILNGPYRKDSEGYSIQWRDINEAGTLVGITAGTYTRMMIIRET